MDWPRPGAVLHTTGPWGRSYLGVGRRAASRAWQRALSKGRHRFTVRETLPWKNTRMGLPEGNQAIQTPSPVQGLTGDPGELTPVLGLASDCSAQSDCWWCWRNGAASVTPASSSRQLPVTQHTGRNWLNAETVESREGVRCRPTRSSTDVYQRGAVRQRMRGGNIPCGVSPHPQGAWLALRLVRQGDGIHYPVCQPLLGDSLPFLLNSVADKKLLRASKAPGAVHVYAQCSYGTQQRQGLICLLRGQFLQVHHLIAEGRGGNLRHVSRPWSQDNVRVGRPEHKALFAHRKCLEVPDPLDGSERGQEPCLSRQELQLDWVQRLKGTPLKSSQDDREVPGGHQGWPRGIQPPGTPQEPYDKIMLSQGPAVHCIVMGRDSSHIHFQGGGWQPTLQPILQERKHYSNHAPSGVFSARRTPVREQTPIQCICLPCWRSSSLSDGLYHSLW